MVGLYRCSCGVEKEIRINSVNTGMTKSCGCLKIKVHKYWGNKVGGWNKTHGMCETRIYSIWHNMINRAVKKNTNSQCYNEVNVCEEWLDFNNFFKDMSGAYSDGLTLDRIDGSKGYSQKNCRWSTYKEQARNMKSNRILTHQGKSYCMAEWADKIDLPYKTLAKRLYDGWSVEKALTTPIKSSSI